VTPLIGGSPHSIQRQVAFGVVAGTIAAILAAKFDFDPILVTTVSAITATLLAGIEPRGGAAPT